METEPGTAQMHYSLLFKEYIKGQQLGHNPCWVVSIYQSAQAPLGYLHRQWQHVWCWPWPGICSWEPWNFLSPCNLWPSLHPHGSSSGHSCTEYWRFCRYYECSQGLHEWKCWSACTDVKSSSVFASPSCSSHHCLLSHQGPRVAAGIVGTCDPGHRRAVPAPAPAGSAARAEVMHGSSGEPSLPWRCLERNQGAGKIIPDSTGSEQPKAARTFYTCSPRVSPSWNPSLIYMVTTVLCFKEAASWWWITPCEWLNGWRGTCT